VGEGLAQEGFVGEDMAEAPLEVAEPGGHRRSLAGTGRNSCQKF
jgi:hypothetical protein